MPDNSPYIFSEETDIALIKQGRRRLTMSLRAQAERRKRWRRNEQLVAGDHFAAFHNHPDDKSKIVYNSCHEVIETIMPILVDLIPVPQVEPRPKVVEGLQLRDLMMKGEDLEAGIEDQWERNGLDEMWSMALKSSLIYGNGPIRILDYENDLYTDLIDIFSYFLQPNCGHLNLSQWIITAAPVNIATIASVYGNDSVKDLKAEGKLDHFRNFQLFTKDEGDGGEPHSISHSRPELDGSDDFVSSEHDGAERDSLDEVLLVDVWCAHDLENEADRDIASTSSEEVDYKAITAYQHLTFASNKILSFDHQTKYDIGEPPFVDIVNYPNPNNPWGTGEPDQIEAMNLAIDVILSEATDAAIMAGNPPLKVTTDVMQANPAGIRIKAGQTVVMPTRASVLEWMQSWQMPQYMQSLPVMLADFINTISGVHDVSQGRKPGQVTAASAIRQLQEAAQSRVRFKIKASMRGPIKRLYQLLLQYIAENVKDVRSKIGRDKQTGNSVIRSYSGKDLNLEDYVVKAGEPLFNNKSDLVNLLLQLQQPLALMPEELVQLMPPEVRDVIMSVRSTQQGADAFEGIDMAQLTAEEKAILQGDDEDARTSLLMRLHQRGAYNPPGSVDQTRVPQNGTPANIA